MSDHKIVGLDGRPVIHSVAAPASAAGEPCCEANISEANKDRAELIARAEMLLKHAQTSDVVSLAYIVVHANGDVSTSWSSRGLTTLIGAAANLQYRMHNAQEALIQEENK